MIGVPEGDSWERVNRGIYAFNDVPDRYLLKPIARGYRAVLPNFMRRGVSNFFDNRALFGMISLKDADHESTLPLATGASTCQLRHS